MFNIGLVQINSSFSGCYYLPYSVGLLQSYSSIDAKIQSNFHFLPPLFRRESIDHAIEKLKSADIVLFSIYVWNERYSLALAEQLKSAYPDILIVFGGPSVPDRAENFLRGNQFVDVVVHQEGERACAEILKQFPKRTWATINGVSYLSQKGEHIQVPSLPRIRDLSEIPSPYLTGVFDELISAHSGYKWLATWETNRGCPFACTYCDWGSATNSKVARMDMERLYKELDWFSTHKIEFIFCADANFGLLPRDLDIALYAAENKKKYGYPHVLSVQNTKNKRDRSYKVQKVLVDAGLSKGVTIAMQSTNPLALKQIKRDNISLDAYHSLQVQFQKDGVPTYTEIILGLPGDTFESYSNGVCDVIRSGQHNKIQFNNLSILPNAELASQEDEFKIKTVETPIVSMHGSIEDNFSAHLIELQRLVIETYSLPQNDWIKTRFFSSLVECLYYCRLLQIVSMICKSQFNIDYLDFFNIFFDVNQHKYPVVSRLLNILIEHAIGITQGKAEFVYSEEWLDIFWPPGEYALIDLVMSDSIESFYMETYQLITEKFPERVDSVILLEAINLNKFMLNIFNKKDHSITMEYDLLKVFEQMKQGVSMTAEKSSQLIKISDVKYYENPLDWMRYVIWYGHRNGSYFINTKSLVLDIAGHY